MGRHQQFYEYNKCDTVFRSLNIKLSEKIVFYFLYLVIYLSLDQDLRVLI